MRRTLFGWLRVLVLFWLVAYALGAPRRRWLAELRFRRWCYATLAEAHPELELASNPYVWRWLRPDPPWYV